MDSASIWGILQELQRQIVLQSLLYDVIKTKGDRSVCTHPRSHGQLAPASELQQVMVSKTSSCAERAALSTSSTNHSSSNDRRSTAMTGVRSNRRSRQPTSSVQRRRACIGPSTSEKQVSTLVSWTVHFLLYDNASRSRKHSNRGRVFLVSKHTSVYGGVYTTGFHCGNRRPWANACGVFSSNAVSRRSRSPGCCGSRGVL